MKVTVLHGENVTESRKRLVAIADVVRKRGWDVSFITGEKSHPISDVVSLNFLFSDNSLKVIDGAKYLDANDFNWLSENENLDANLLIWHSKLIDKRLLNKVKSVNVEEFSVQRIIFSFLDSLWSGNLKNALKTYKELVENEAPEFVFSMMGSQFRDLYWAQEDKQSMGYPEWRKGKLSQQAGKYKVNQLIKLIKKLSAIDMRVKKGYSDLNSEIEKFLLINLA